jgi:glycosyltransferase involved in cell wall biosynthesis
MQSAPLRMCIVTTIAMPMNVFMGPHIRELAERFEITLLANAAEAHVADLLSPRVRFEYLPIQRAIAPWSDLESLVMLWRRLRRGRFDVVQSMMPKSGLLAMAAGALARVPVRVHWFTGQVWATQRGLRRSLLKAMDRVLAGCATHLFADSFSQREFLVSQGIVSADRVTVLSQGSVCGVDTTRFKPDPDTRARVRAKLGIAESSVVALYLGRLNRDKGIPELAEAFASAARECPDMHLVLVGPDEEQMRPLVTDRLAEVADRVHFVDYTREPQSFLACADFFVLASHREGFGSTIIESAACGIPAIGTRIYGLTDAIVEGETGLLVPPRDVVALAAAMTRLARDSHLRHALGRNALGRVQRDFRQEVLTKAVSNFYSSLMGPRACR